MLNGLSAGSQILIYNAMIAFLLRVIVHIFFHKREVPIYKLEGFFSSLSVKSMFSL